MIRMPSNFDMLFFIAVIFGAGFFIGWMVFA